MHQPGVEVRPLRQMNGHASFNEVFLDRRPRARRQRRSAQIGGGWAVALTTLAHERRLGAATGAPDVERRGPGRALREAAAERRSLLRALRVVPAAGRARRPGGRAAGGHRAAATIRSCARRSPGARARPGRPQWTQRRARAARALGRPPGPEGSLGKLAAQRDRPARRPGRTRADRRGVAACSSGPDSPLERDRSPRSSCRCRGVDRRRHRRDPAQHPGRARPRPAQGAAGRRDLPFRDVPKNPTR